MPMMDPQEPDGSPGTSTGSTDGAPDAFILVERDMFQDAGQQEPGGLQLAVPDGSPGMPEEFAIGTTKAFAKGYAYEYEKRQIRNATIYGATIYVCKRGNDWAEQNEKLVLLRDRSGIWTAWDSHVNQSSVALRQPIFRCPGNITQPGWYKWEINYAGRGLKGDWHGALEAETRVP